MAEHHIEAHFEVSVQKDRDRAVMERAVVLLADALRPHLSYREKFEAEKFARVIVLGVTMLPQVMKQAIGEVDG